MVESAGDKPPPYGVSTVGSAGDKPPPYLRFMPRARIRSRRVLRFMPSSSAARSWFPLVRATAAAMSGPSTACRAAV